MFTGSMVALVTPMLEDGSIDYESLSALVEFHVENGTDAIVAVGTTGESATLDVDEHCAVIKHVIKVANGRIPVIAGTGANSTSEAIELTEAAHKAGADAALLVTPYYNKPTQEGLYQHFRTIAETVAIPQILYNVPGRTACDMLPETVGRLSRIANIIGIKDATADLSRVATHQALCEEGFELYSGDDATTVDFIALGGQGCISVTANVAPRQMHEICSAAVAGDIRKAREINAELIPLHRDLFIESNPIPVKWALHEMGKVSAAIRLPLTPLSESARPRLREAMRFAGLIPEEE